MSPSQTPKRLPDVPELHPEALMPLPPLRQLRRKGETVSSVARFFGVARTTLAYALQKTEREIQRAPETRGRPNALTPRQVLWGVLGYFGLDSR